MAKFSMGEWCYWDGNDGRRVQIIGVDKKGYTVLGACKWWKDPVGENVLNDLLTARAALGPKASGAELAIFSKVGFNDKLTKRAKSEGVHLVVADDLFK